MSHEQKISRTMLEQKSLHLPFELKRFDQSGRFAGYASIFGVVDNQNDVIEAGAFSETLKGRVHEIRLLWQHKQEEPIGHFRVIFEDKRGLYVEGQLQLEVKRAREALALMQTKALSGLSIGYSPTRYSIDAATGIRYLQEVQLWEISLVTFPANEGANITVVKGGGVPKTQEQQFSASVMHAMHQLQ